MAKFFIIFLAAVGLFFFFPLENSEIQIVEGDGQISIEEFLLEKAIIVKSKRVKEKFVKVIIVRDNPPEEWKNLDPEFSAIVVSSRKDDTLSFLFIF